MLSSYCRLSLKLICLSRFILIIWYLEESSLYHQPFSPFSCSPAVLSVLPVLVSPAVSDGSGGMKENVEGKRRRDGGDMEESDETAGCGTKGAAGRRRESGGEGLVHSNPSPAPPQNRRPGPHVPLTTWEVREGQPKRHHCRSERLYRCG